MKAAVVREREHADHPGGAEAMNNARDRPPANRMKMRRRNDQGITGTTGVRA